MDTNEIVLYHPNETMELEVRLYNETVWLTQQQIADLSGTKRPTITKYLSNIFKSGELEEESTCSILKPMAADSSRRYSTKHYNLDVILSFGYRVQLKLLRIEYFEPKYDFQFWFGEFRYLFCD